MKRILFFAPNYLPAMRYGGPVSSIHGLAKALAAAGHVVDVLTTNVDGPDRLDVPLDRPVEIDGVQVHYCPISVPRRIYYSRTLAKRAAELLPLADIVHLNGMFLWPGPYLARAARAKGQALVVSPRGMLMPEMVAGKSHLIKKAWIRLQERANLAAATAIHVTSDIEAEGLRALGLNLAPVKVIANGVEMPLSPPKPDEIADIWGDVPSGRRVAFLGRLDWTKGVDMAIEATRAHPNAIIRVAGHDQIGLRAGLEPRLQRDDGTICGAFLGPLDGAQKWAFLAGADVLLVPSLRESFGMSVVEALAMGTPAIVTPGVGAREIVASVDPGLICERDAEALTRSLQVFLSDDARRRAMGDRARRIISEKYAWETIAESMVRVYSEGSN